jgi:hypothetical protein
VEPPLEIEPEEERVAGFQFVRVLQIGQSFAGENASHAGAVNAENANFASLVLDRRDAIAGGGWLGLSLKLNFGGLGDPKLLIVAAKQELVLLDGEDFIVHSPHPLFRRPKAEHGNRMNDGTFRGGAQAFKLDTLLKLSDVKGKDINTTHLNFVVQEIIRSEVVTAARAAKESRSSSSIKSDDLLEETSHDTE